MTAATPMISPSIVSPERSLFERRARMAMATMSSTIIVAVFRAGRARPPDRSLQPGGSPPGFNRLWSVLNLPQVQGSR